MNLPTDCKYTPEHEWVRSGDTVTVGITDHAQAQLGDVVFVDLPAVGKVVSKGDTFGTVESVKAVSDLFAPLSGEVTEVNTALVDSPEAVNADPYSAGWMIKLKPSNSSELAGLLSPADYQKLLPTA
jgi:glycine cleavage system H protein